jgi:hypothetical protein
MFSGGLFLGRRKAGHCVKIPLLLLGLLVSVSAISQAGPARGGFHGGGFHSGFAGRGLGNRGGFQGRFVAPGIRRGLADRRFFGRNRFVQQFGWPVYWYPWYSYDDSLDYSYLEPDSQPDYQYWDNSSAYRQEQPTTDAVPQKPVVLVINTGNSRATDSSGPADLRGVMGPTGDGRYVSNGNNYNAGLGQQRVLGQDPKNNTVTGSMTPGDRVVPQATPAPQPNAKTSTQMGTGPFNKFVIVSYLNDRGKDVIAIRNIETNDVQRITSQPNIDHFRIVEIHPNSDLRQFEAIISNGSDQGPVRFQF